MSKALEIEVMTKKQAAALLGVTTRTIDNYMKENQFPVYKYRNMVRFKKDEIIEFLERNKVNQV